MPVRAPRTQQQRRDETRRALLDAAVESLIEVGFARTTTLEVQRRAEVSRGALLHHFPSKAELLVAAVDHLAEMRAKELKVLAMQLPANDHTRERTDAVIGLLWQCFSGAFFQVAMELRAAARTDPELRPVLAVAEKSLRERIFAQARALFGKPIAEHPGLERALDLTLQLMIGSAMSAVLHTDEVGGNPAGSAGRGDSPGKVRRLDLLIDDWKALFPAVLEHAGQQTKAKKRVTR